jgi:type II secretory pathway component PulK
VRTRKGTILAAVLVITALAAMIAASLMYQVRAETSAATAAGRGEQAWAAVISGIEQAGAVLADSAGQPDDWRDAPETFAHQLVAEDGATRWYFTIYAPSDEDPYQPRFGLVDESGKINVNLADEQTLRALPQLTGEQVDALLDYRDADSDPRPGGAEQDYYDRLDPPYLIKNQPAILSVEELLLVKGFDGPTVYGEDWNLNGLLEPREDDGDDQFPPDDRDGVLDGGLRQVLTATAVHPGLSADGSERVDLNGELSAIEALTREGLSARTVEFIRQVRQDGHRFSHPSQLWKMTYELTRKPDRNGPNARRQGPQDQDDDPVVLQSPVTREELPVVIDRLTTAPSRPRADGRVIRPRTAGQLDLNVNTASATVLSALPVIDANLAGRIVDARRGLSAGERETIAWLVTQNVVDAETFKKVAPHLESRGYQYRMTVVGYGVPAGRFRVAEVVLDIAGKSPRIRYLRELTRLGLPIAMDADGQWIRR